jgi:hypothetical protein
MTPLPAAPSPHAAADSGTDAREGDDVVESIIDR